MKPGDFFEWYDPDRSLTPLSSRAEMYSSSMCRWIPVGGQMINMIISIFDDKFMWINSMGIFHVKIAKCTTKRIVTLVSIYEARKISRRISK